MKIYFDKYGYLKKVEQPIFQQTSDKADQVIVIPEFSTREFITTITFKRADGLILGPFTMHRHEDDSDSFDVIGQIIAIPGELEMTIRYNILTAGVVTSTKAMSKITAQVLESVEKGNDILSAIYERVKDGVYFEDGKDGKSAYEIAVDNGFEGSEQEWLETIHSDPIYEGSTPPDNPYKYVWLVDVDGNNNDLVAEEDNNTLVAEEGNNTIIAEEE